MQTFKRLAVNPMDAQESIRFGVALLGIYGIMSGSTSLLWAGTTLDFTRYSALLEAPGGLSLWSMVVILTSCVLVMAVVAGWKRVAAVMLFVGAIWNTAIAVGFFQSYLENASFTPLSFISMGAIGVVHCQKSWLLWSSRKVDRVLLADAAKLARGKD